MLFSHLKYDIMMKIGIIAETKNPPDTRTPLTPDHAAEIQRKFPVKIYVLTSPNRCYSDQEYIQAGIEVVDSVSHCDILMGIKEPKVESLIPGKTYLIFSHTIKKQPHNRHLLQAILEKNIRLIDYEVLTDEAGNRLAAFGFFAGMVGAHNGIMAYGKRIGHDVLPKMYACKDYEEVKMHYSRLALPPVKMVITGTGRVGNGAAKVLHDMHIRHVTPSEFLEKQYSYPVYTQLGVLDYYTSDEPGGLTREMVGQCPEKIKSAFLPFARVAEVFIHGIFWSPKYPAFLTLEDMKSSAFKVKVIADIACDIAPEASLPSTIRASSIADPVYGFDPATGQEIPPSSPHGIDIMAIDNLPSELPRDASHAFSRQLSEYVLPALIHSEHSGIIHRATIAKDGHLESLYHYLNDYVTDTP
jgi:saccharopine dehydrogenase (NAD+, L-lysine forming)